MSENTVSRLSLGQKHRDTRSCHPQKRECELERTAPVGSVRRHRCSSRSPLRATGFPSPPRTGTPALFLAMHATDYNNQHGRARYLQHPPPPTNNASNLDTHLRSSVGGVVAMACTNPTLTHSLAKAFPRPSCSHDGTKALQRVSHGHR